MSNPTYDIAVIGAGVVGLSFAMQMGKKHPQLRLLVLEKEDGVARHQTGHNSGVIHAGIYYKPGSLKAKLCVQGAREMVEFCQQQSIPYEICGKLIVASTPEESRQLEVLHQRGCVNGLVGLRLLEREAMRRLNRMRAGYVRCMFL